MPINVHTQFFFPYGDIGANITAEGVPQAAQRAKKLGLNIVDGQQIMLEAREIKSADEIHLLKEGLMATRMAFVAATQNSSTTGTSSAADGPPPSNAPTMLSPTATPDNAESAKRYSKKY